MGTKKTTTKTVYKSLSFERNYKSFSDFYDTHKTEIYKSIIELFNEFKITNRKVLSLKLCAKIDNLEWDTEFNFTKDESIVLKRDIMPYFEDTEDYETCSEIIKLDFELTNS
jgi:hypothetical protein